MSPLSIRGASVAGFLLFAALGSICGAPKRAWAVEAAIPAKPEILDKELQDLLIRRYEAAKEQATALVGLYPAGRAKLENVCESILRSASAGIEADESPNDCIKRCEAVFQLAKTVEDAV